MVLLSPPSIVLSPPPAIEPVAASSVASPLNATVPGVA
eukprot:CAMPEP_0205942946 /NCGR_PEP_ID=MMETSP1325-20131115/59112_1 /ASSEMBLY_ACC=CAM_ASM_000708 /TAXON_ID=236786 /ORGANISM="Florenciella sp., Strain RCC1007" /LENGTH=37 /DNA_ID= /DNA_START= /DNA_END= /DNA_ORIENTATION=